MTREEKEQKLVECWTDAMELAELISFFMEKQKEYLETLTDEEFDEQYKEYVEVE